MSAWDATESFSLLVLISFNNIWYKNFVLGSLNLDKSIPESSILDLSLEILPVSTFLLIAVLVGSNSPNATNTLWSLVKSSNFVLYSSSTLILDTSSIIFNSPSTFCKMPTSNKAVFNLSVMLFLWRLDITFLVYFLPSLCITGIK